MTYAAMVCCHIAKPASQTASTRWLCLTMSPIITPPDRRSSCGILSLIAAALVICQTVCISSASIVVVACATCSRVQAKSGRTTFNMVRENFSANGHIAVDFLTLGRIGCGKLPAISSAFTCETYVDRSTPTMRQLRRLRQ